MSKRKIKVSDMIEMLNEFNKDAVLVMASESEHSMTVASVYYVDDNNKKVCIDLVDGKEYS